MRWQNPFRWLTMFLLLLGGGSSANAYVRSRTDMCAPLYWPQSCIYVQADGNFVQDMHPADIEQAIQNAIHAWQTTTQSSGFLQIKYLPPEGPKETTYKDGLQVIAFRSQRWCRPATDENPEVCYDPSATAITIVTYIRKPGDPRDGQIVDADIELNAVNNLFFVADPNHPVSPQPTDPRNPADLWNTLTHEMGHMQGLEHTCRGPADEFSVCTVDNQGAVPPLCTDVVAHRLINPTYAAIYDTTMFAVATPAEVRKRIPKPDDIQGIVDSYPAAEDPQQCIQPGTSPNTVCTISQDHATHTHAGLGTLVLLVAGLLLARTTGQRFGHNTQCAESSVQASAS